MSFIDWGIAGSNPQNQVAQQTALQENLNRDQQLRALSALRGINVGDQGSVQSGINALTGLGMMDQASALTNLAQTRAQNTSTLPLIQEGASQALAQMRSQEAAQTQQSSDQQPDLDAAHRQILQQGADAVNDLLSYDDPNLRAAAAAIYRQKFAQMGIPAGNIDEVLGDLSDQGLKQHEAFLTAAANGQEADHPTGYAASRDVFNANNPGSQQAIQTLSGWMMNPVVQGVFEKAGIPLSSGINQAISITNPARAAAASAPYNLTTVEGPQGQPVQMSAANFAAGQAQPGAQPIVGATPYVRAAQTEAAAAPYRPVTVPTGVPGQTKTESAAQFAGAPPAVSATAAQTTGAVGGAEANTQQATNFENYSGGYNVRKANLENLRLAAGDISTGPQAPFWGRLGALAAEYGIKSPITPTANQAAAYEEVQKMAQSVLSQQKDALGLPNTNQSVTLATGATPHESTSPLGLQRLAGVLEGNEDYINATRQAWDRWKQQGHGYETYQQFVPQFMQTFHPQVFQAQYLDPTERAKVRQQFGPARFDAETAVARRLGFLAQ